MNQCQLGSEGASHIAQGLGKNTTLKSLNLSENSFGDEGAENFAQFMILYEGFSLKHFDISDNFISDVVGLRLAEALTYNKSLETLNLQKNTLTQNSGFALRDTISKHPNLCKVDLSSNLIPLKIITEIDKHTAVNADRGDLKALPGLKREVRKQKQHRVDP